ncbi:aspartate--tRNA ligase [bacterium]|nr:aspartate--tRNA ligase [bacterium]
MLRTHNLGELNEKMVGQEVVLSAWVHYRRDHGALIFVNIRDHYGLVQVKFDKDKDSELFKKAEELKSEWVIQVKGIVLEREGNNKNPDMVSGNIEIEAKELNILNKSEILPFEISELKTNEAQEALRLKYRFLDLRKEKLQNLLKTKAEFLNEFRTYFRNNGFLEIQTPILANSSPEGARDFLVPSRIYPGKFYALPQAPQQFKQLLMVGGIDKYFQIAPCFRDEDPRQDRHYGEFYQLDMEMSFIEIDDIFSVMEPIMKTVTEKFSKKKIIKLDENNNFIRMPWKEAIDKYGIDKPDLRYGLEFVSVKDIFSNTDFKVFKDNLEDDCDIKAMVSPEADKFSRKVIDELTEEAKKKGAKGLAYIIIKENGEIQSPISKFLSEEEINNLKEKTGVKNNEIIFFSADKWRTACESLGAVRNKVASILDLADNSLASWLWVVDFPMYDYSEIEEGRVDFSHNPFSMPQGGLEALKTQKPLDILAYQFDLILNGVEISSGGIRNHNPETMYKAFEIAGYKKEEVDEKFGAMIKAFSFGAPPHGGNAPGVDRLLMVLQDLDSIRDIYAFPKDGQGRDLMTDSPAEVDEKNLEEINIKIDKPKKK